MFPILKLVKKHWKPDILHLHWQDPFLTSNSRIKTILKSSRFICELVLVKLVGIKIVWTAHNIISHEKKSGNMEFFYTKLLTRLCNKIIAHSQPAKDNIINFYAVRNSLVSIIPHGNYIDCYENAIDEIHAKKQLQIMKYEIVFLYFGLIRPYKGIPYLIDSFKLLKSQKVKLLIVGNPLNDEIADEIIKRCDGDKRIITIFKFIPDDDIQIYMNASDIVIFPFKNILTSGSVILAMSFAKPIICPDISSMADIVHDNNGGFLYDTKDKYGLLEAMKKAFNADLDKIGQYNFKLAEQFRWDLIAKKTHSIYQECLEKRS